MKINLFGLIKFGQRIHMEELYKRGTIYMNQLSEFLKVDDNGLRGDKHESLSAVEKIHNIEILYQGTKIGYAEAGKISLWHYELSGNIYSMYSLFLVDDLEELIIDQKCKEFGNCLVIITNVEEFILRIKREAEKHGIDVIYGPIEYVNVKDYFGNWSVFKKPSEYSFQKEFRFFIRHESTGPFCLNLGSIEDISIMMDSDNLEKLSFERLSNILPKSAKI